MTIAFPEDGIRCVSGDYLVQRTTASTWRVFRVQELVLLSRLVPFGSDELIEEQHVLDSTPAWRMNEVHVLLTPFTPELPSSEAATRAIDASELGDAGLDVCVRISDLRTEDCVVHR